MTGEQWTGRETEGARRFFRAPLKGLELEELPERALRLRFELTAGAYATVLLREVLKNGETSGTE